MLGPELLGRGAAVAQRGEGDRPWLLGYESWAAGKMEGVGRGGGEASLWPRGRVFPSFFYFLFCFLKPF